MKIIEKKLRYISVLKFPLAIIHILCSLVGCNQTPSQSTATMPAANPVLEVVSAPAPLKITNDEPRQLRPKPVQPPSSSWITTVPYEFEEEPSHGSEEQDSQLLEPVQEKWNLTTQEYADMQIEALLNSPPSPSAWLNKIRERVLVEEPEEAKATMDAFFLIYPKHPVDESLLEQVYGPVWP